MQILHVSSYKKQETISNFYQQKAIKLKHLWSLERIITKNQTN